MPCTRIQFLGTILDSVNECLELPVAKEEKLLALAIKLMGNRKIHKTELQRLIGHRTFASRAVYGARAFSRIFIHALKMGLHTKPWNSCNEVTCG